MKTSKCSDTARDLEFRPLVPDLWPDFEKLFGAHGAYGGCWCMWWRISRGQFAKNQSEGNRRAMEALVRAGHVTGILAYRKGVPIGWCSVAPRESYPSLERSPVLRRLDDEPVWSIVCFFVTRAERKEGVSRALVRAAVDYVKEKGGKIVEAYPTCPRSSEVPPTSSFMGFPRLFEEAGFVRCVRHLEENKIQKCRTVLLSTNQNSYKEKDVRPSRSKEIFRFTIC